MKTISFIQPWASLVAIGAKCIETRSWTTPYRGPLAIHASAKYPAEDKTLARSPLFAETLQAGGYDDPTALPLGCVIAVAELSACKRIRGIPDYDRLPDEPELSFGDYRAGRYMWKLVNVKRLPEPVPAKGMLGLWDWPVEKLRTWIWIEIDHQGGDPTLKRRILDSAIINHFLYGHGHIFFCSPESLIEAGDKTARLAGPGAENAGLVRATFAQIMDRFMKYNPRDWRMLLAPLGLSDIELTDLENQIEEGGAGAGGLQIVDRFTIHDKGTRGGAGGLTFGGGAS